MTLSTSRAEEKTWQRPQITSLQIEKVGQVTQQKWLIVIGCKNNHMYTTKAVAKNRNQKLPSPTPVFFPQILFFLSHPLPFIRLLPRLEKSSGNTQWYKSNGLPTELSRWKEDLEFSDNVAMVHSV